MSTIKIKIAIAGRHYPMMVEREDEKILREVGKEINLMIKDLEEKYAISDKQDTIAMCALNMISKLKIDQHKSADNKIHENIQLIKLNELIDTILKK